MSGLLSLCCVLTSQAWDVQKESASVENGRLQTPILSGRLQRRSQLREVSRTQDEYAG